MKKQYTKPSIVIIEQIYGEGLMTTWSTGVSTNPPPGPPSGAKPGDAWDTASWGNIWDDPTPDLSNTYDKLDIPMN